MSKIKKWIDFNEAVGPAVSGTMDTMPYGPGSPRQNIPVTLSNKDTSVLYSPLTDKFYQKYEYDDLYNEYIKKGGKPLFDFNLENLEKVISYLI